MDYSPPGSSVHWIFQARILAWVAISFSRGSSWPRDQTRVSHIAGRFFIVWATMHACMLSHFSCAQLFATQGTTIRQTLLSLGFSRQEYGNGLPCPSPEYLPDPGIKPTSLLSPALAGKFFTTSATWGATELPYRVLNPGEPISKPTALQCYHSWQASSILQLALALPSLWKPMTIKGPGLCRQQHEGRVQQSELFQAFTESWGHRGILIFRGWGKWGYLTSLPPQA